MSLATSPTIDRIEIIESFTKIPDVCHAIGKRHKMALSLALLTLAIVPIPGSIPRSPLIGDLRSRQ